jgi:hypothetical protein
MKRKRASKGVLIDVLLLLVCLLCITTCLSSGILAKYTSESAGNAGARIAGFVVSATAKQDENDPLKYSVTVESKSEVAVSYSLELVFDAPVKDTVTVTVNGHEYAAEDSADDRIVIPALGVLGAGESTAEITLEFKAEGVTAPINFDTFVRFEQVD